MQPGAAHRSEYIPRVFHPVYVADFISVIRRDWNFLDALIGQHQLNDDFGIEMKIIRVALERDLPERVRGIEAITGMKFGEPCVKHEILKMGQHLISDPFIKRHSTAQGVALCEHPRAKNRV